MAAKFRHKFLVFESGGTLEQSAPPKGGSGGGGGGGFRGLGGTPLASVGPVTLRCALRKRSAHATVTPHLHVGFFRAQ